MPLLSTDKITKRYPCVTALDALDLELERGIVGLVGIDYLSIDRFRASPHEVHETLLASRVVILEGLDLRSVTVGGYLLVCAPLNVVGAEGAPRAPFSSIRARSDEPSPDT